MTKLNGWWTKAMFKFHKCVGRVNFSFLIYNHCKVAVTTRWGMRLLVHHQLAFCFYHAFNVELFNFQKLTFSKRGNFCSLLFSFPDVKNKHQEDIWKCYQCPTTIENSISLGRIFALQYLFLPSIVNINSLIAKVAIIETSKLIYMKATLSFNELAHSMSLVLFHAPLKTWVKF